MHIIPSTVIHLSWTLWHVWVTTCHSFRMYNYLFMHLSHRTSYNISLRVTGYNKTIFHTARQPRICNIGQHTRHMTLMSHGCHGISNRWQFHYVFNKLFIPKTKKNWTPLLSICEWIYRSPVYFDKKWVTSVRLQNLPWSKTGLVSRQVLHPLSKLQNWIWSKTGRYKTGLISNTKIEASLRATKSKPWQSNLTSDTVEIFIQNEKAGLVPMQSRFRSRHKAGFGAAGLGTAQSWFWSRHKASFGAVSRPV